MRLVALLVLLATVVGVLICGWNMYNNSKEVMRYNRGEILKMAIIAVIRQ